MVKYNEIFELENLQFLNDENCIETEEWRTVVNVTNDYQVSNLGRIKSMNFNHTKKPRIMKQRKDKDGYLLVTLFNNCPTSMKVHRLVAMAFISNPENKPQVNHIDGNKLNNCLKNLEWNTSKENVNHAVNNGLKIIHGEFNPKSVLKEKEVLEIRAIGKKISNAKLSKTYGVCTTTISAIKLNKTWKHI